MLTDLPIESSLESIRAEVDWARKVFLTLMFLSLTQTLGTQNGASDDEKFYTIVHLRQNFEKVGLVAGVCGTHDLSQLQARNLVYMVQRRERLKRQLLQKDEELFHLESSVLLQEDGRPKLHLDPVSTRHTRYIQCEFF